ncbi:exported hypothetical protein [uncultured Desulfovibrio sp.]|uniref:Uncharacterized protein n=1 Tax=uncultured Desulfovibrio sp. TaxID=167968 RepID=A0A212J7C2_9BACT|nr:exported hypothetical protein [uncultured Desulfovibrio sp.]
MKDRKCRSRFSGSCGFGLCVTIASIRVIHVTRHTAPFENVTHLNISTTHTPAQAFRNIQAIYSILFLVLAYTWSRYFLTAQYVYGSSYCKFDSHSVVKNTIQYLLHMAS